MEYIRANQGHSLACVSTEEIMSKITDPSTVPVCVHGTYRKFLRPILSTGKKLRTRTVYYPARDSPSKLTALVSPVAQVSIACSATTFTWPLACRHRE